MGIELPTDLFAAASKQTYTFNKNQLNFRQQELAERALRDLLDGLVLDLEVTGDYSDELPKEFVRLIIVMMRALNYKQSLEGYLMNVIASDQVNPGFVFRAQWPGSEPNLDRTPVVYVQRFADERH